MNLNKLFTLQDKLDDHIKKEKGLEGQDLLDKKILALQVELGELANEWRGFKFWKVNPRPRTEDWIECSVCNGTGDLNYERVQEEAEGSGGHEYIDCEECDSSGTSHMINPLLEEYVDCLHFILSIGLELGAEKKFADEVNFNIGTRTITRDTLDIFQQMFNQVNLLSQHTKVKSFFECDVYNDLFSIFSTLGDSLGFTEEQIEQAYISKNEVNHERQENGY